ncbi:DUF5799 family protein [Natronorubrum bangense]|uniref:Uncharacterized protein n=2 Tax=Natronorubrum bangense TaxID=61858 RepID=L9WRU0_9EURY|nr:DUF5799 family protein [Natronorubrum bangense]ELY51931.1 hypothetical protein C494_02321 [Natronorubrum bangense JCM 10635]QCC54845.1 hypothetical protein DV706_10440 [Natronorubrum bangense]
MSDNPWTDRIVGARMTVDQAFSARIADSEFSNQQWSLIMTATEFEIEHPDDPDRARIVANTDSVEQIIPELENMPTGMGAMGGQGAGKQGGSSSGGLFASIKGALGLDGGDDDDHADKLQAAERLTQEYADELQSHLESEGRWESVRKSVAADT